MTVAGQNDTLCTLARAVRRGALVCGLKDISRNDGGGCACDALRAIFQTSELGIPSLELRNHHRDVLVFQAHMCVGEQRLSGRGTKILFDDGRRKTMPLRRSQLPNYQEPVMRVWTGVMIVAAIAAAAYGCAPTPSARAVIEDKVYTVTPDKVQVKAGIVNGEVTELKVTERVEQGTGRIDTPAKLTGKLKLTNSSTDQTVRLLGGRILYIDDQGKVIKIEEARTEPALKFQSSYNATDRLDPGQDATQSVEVDFPAEALKVRKLKEIRIELAYIPSSYKLQTAGFSVSIGGQ
jgi:hypothetical protein